MRKSTVFISALLTTFALVMLYRLALAYNEDQKLTEITAPSAEPTATLAPTATEPPAPTEVVLGPEEAARLAVQVVGNTNLLSAESSNFNGVDAYLITFTNNDVVYVGLDGQVLGVQVAPVVVNIAPPPKQKSKNKGGGGQNESNESRQEEHHESSEEHHEEEHED
jgi:hypothetical protein